MLMRPSEQIQSGASLSDWESSSDSAACGMEATWPQITPELAHPAQEVDFLQGGALLPPAGHGVKAMRLQATRKCQERSSDPFCSTGQNCSHSPQRTYRTTCWVQKHPGGAEGQECDGGGGAFTAGWISTTLEGPQKGLHPPWYI